MVGLTWWQVDLVGDRSVIQSHLRPLVPVSEDSCGSLSHGSI